MLARLRVIVNTPLPPGSQIETRAYVTWDENPELVVGAEPLRIRSAPAMPIVDPLLPFAVLDAAAGRAEPAGRGRQLEIAGETTYIQLPPAVPVKSNGAREHVLPAAQPTRLAPAPAPAPEETRQGGAAVFLDLDDERLEWIVQYLEEARFPGLLGHLMVLRALLPDTAIAPDATAELKRYAATLEELVDRLFLKLRLPDATLHKDDLETKESRAALKAAIAALRHSPAHGRPDEEGLRIEGFVAGGVLEESVAMLQRAKLVTAAPWRVLAAMMGTSLRRDGVPVADFAPYRDALLRALSELAGLSPTEFEAALHKPTDIELETERESVVRTLAEQRRVNV